jgi:hypothetical protein
MDVDRSNSVWEYHPTSHKTEHHDRDRIIFIGPKAQAEYHVVSVGSEPAADVWRALASLPEVRCARVRVTLFDLDPEALEFGQRQIDVFLCIAKP